MCALVNDVYGNNNKVLDVLLEVFIFHELSLWDIAKIWKLKGFEKLRVKVNSGCRNNGFGILY